jgi:hypothetical protein
MSKPNKLDFYNLDTYHKNSFIIHSFSTSGKASSTISKYDKIKTIFQYILDRYAERPEGLQSRKIRIIDHEKKYIRIEQTSIYEDFSSYKFYVVTSDSADEIEELLNLVYNHKFDGK